ncbi:MAG: RelA/SpoT family protein [Gammaproteobacteria bacterium]
MVATTLKDGMAGGGSADFAASQRPAQEAPGVRRSASGGELSGLSEWPAGPLRGALELAVDEGRLEVAIAAVQALRVLHVDEHGLCAAALVVGAPALCADRQTVEARFGAETARLVNGARRMAEIGDYRRAQVQGDEGQQMTRLRSLLLLLAEDLRVVLVKLVERLIALRSIDISSVEHTVEGEDEVTARECLEMYAPLAGRLGVRQLKWELEDLSFRALERPTYNEIARRLRERRADRERYIDNVVTLLRAELDEAGLEVDVSGRSKHIYSIYKKMRSKNLDFDQVFDLRAVRVLVEDVTQCYAALGAVHALWPHIPREFDDYITRPKPNGYRSLHTAVIGPEGHTLEVQIRTRDMHAQAELGVAAHWRYKEGEGHSDRALESRLQWMRQLLEGDAQTSGDIIDALRSELMSERVYVFTPQGAILDLPAGATPLDFAYTVHTDLGHQCRGAKINGTIVHLNQALHSGDRVEILRDRKSGPSRDWLNPNLGFIKSARVRAKVRQWFKQQDHAANVADGEAIFARELKRLGVTDPDRGALCSRFNFKRIEDLMAALGAGDITVGQITGALQRQLSDTGATPEFKVRRSEAGEAKGTGGSIAGLLTKVARCCNPVPPEPITGYITQGRGVTVHRRACANVVRLGQTDDRRLIELDWSEIGRAVHPVRVTVVAYDRQGLLRDITTAIANEKVNVTGIDSKTAQRDTIARVDVTIEVDDLSQLGRILDRLGTLKNIIEASRVA